MLSIAVYTPWTSLVFATLAVRVSSWPIIAFAGEFLDQRPPGISDDADPGVPVPERRSPGEGTRQRAITSAAPAARRWRPPPSRAAPHRRPVPGQPVGLKRQRPRRHFQHVCRGRKRPCGLVGVGAGLWRPRSGRAGPVVDRHQLRQRPQSKRPERLEQRPEFSQHLLSDQHEPPGVLDPDYVQLPPLWQLPRRRAHGLLADAHVGFVNDTIDMKTYQAHQHHRGRQRWSRATPTDKGQLPIWNRTFAGHRA